jgi:rRNA-processing protein FCF1
MIKYCLDANFFVQGWNKYYSPDFCSGYWDIIDNLGKNGIVFIPQEVMSELQKKDDNLKKWLKDKKHLEHKIDLNVQNCLKELYITDPSHKLLTNSEKNRSMADPWVIAHAMAQNAIVVTKEVKDTNPNSKKIKIPNVCENMNIECIDDFEFIRRMKLNFECKL